MADPSSLVTDRAALRQQLEAAIAAKDEKRARHAELEARETGQTDSLKGMRGLYRRRIEADIALLRSCLLILSGDEHEPEEDVARVDDYIAMPPELATASTDGRDPDKTYRLDLKARKLARGQR